MLRDDGGYRLVRKFLSSVNIYRLNMNLMLHPEQRVAFSQKRKPARYHPDRLVSLSQKKGERSRSASI